MSEHETEAERKAREKREKEEAARRRRLLGKGQAGRASDKLKAREKKLAEFWENL